MATHLSENVVVGPVGFGQNFQGIADLDTVRIGEPDGWNFGVIFLQKES